MARAGTARTDRAGVARFDLRVGSLSQAGLLLPEHSLGVIQSVGVSAERNTVMLKSGTPQQTVAVETISSDLIFTANINEKSKRNIKLFLNTGIVDYDTDKTEYYDVDTTSGVDDTSVTLKAYSFADKKNKTLAAYNAAINASGIFTKISELTGITPSNAVAAFNKVDEAVFNAKLKSISASTPFRDGQTAAKNLLASGTACTDAQEAMPNGILSASSIVIGSINVSNEANANEFLKGFKAVKDAFDAGANVTAAYAAASGVTGTTETVTITFNSVPAGYTSPGNEKTIIIAGRTIELSTTTASTGAQIATAFVSGNTTAVAGATPSGSLSGYTATANGNVVTLVSTIPGAVPDVAVTGTLKSTNATKAYAPTLVISQGSSTGVALAGMTSAKDFLDKLNEYDSATSTLVELKAVLDDIYAAVLNVVNNTNTVSANTTSTKSDFLSGFNSIKSIYSALDTSGTTLMQSGKVILNALMQLIIDQADEYYGDTLYFEGISSGFKYVQAKVSAYYKTYPLALLETYTTTVTDAVSDKQSEADAAGVSTGSYVIYDKNDPMTLAVIDIASFNNTTGEATLVAGTTVGVDFPATASLTMYKANVIAPLRDFSMPYYTVRLVELDSKTRSPEVTDIWKCAITSGSNMTLNSTDFSAWDIVLTSMYPTISDLNGDLAHVRDKVNVYGACARYTLNDI